MTGERVDERRRERDRPLALLALGLGEPQHTLDEVDVAPAQAEQLSSPPGPDVFCAARWRGVRFAAPAPLEAPEGDHGGARFDLHPFGGVGARHERATFGARTMKFDAHLLLDLFSAYLIWNGVLFAATLSDLLVGTYLLIISFVICIPTATVLLQFRRWQPKAA